MPFRCGTLILNVFVYCELAVAKLLLESHCGPNKAYKHDTIGNAKQAQAE